MLTYLASVLISYSFQSLHGDLRPQKRKNRRIPARRSIAEQAIHTRIVMSREGSHWCCRLPFLSPQVVQIGAPKWSSGDPKVIKMEPYPLQGGSHRWPGGGTPRHTPHWRLRRKHNTQFRLARLMLLIIKRAHVILAQ